MEGTKTRKATGLLSSEHLATHLSGSAISEDVLNERGCYTVTKKAELERRGFGNRQIKPPGVLYPVHSVSGEIGFYLYRADDPRIIRGRPAKYELPKGQSMAIDVPPRCREHLGNPGIPLVITEGIKKSDSAASKELCTISLIGTWNWRGTNDQGGKTALPDWEYIAFKDRHGRPRTVYLCFDSDVMTKPPVYKALERLKAFLEQRGARVRVIYLPHGKHGEKVGLDDFFARGATRDDLLSLAVDHLKPPPAEGRRGEHQHVVDVLEGIPASSALRVPGGYELGEGGVHSVTLDPETYEERRSPVAPAPVILAGRTTDVNDGRESAELVYKRRDRWQRRSASRSQIMNSREVVKLSDYGVPVSSGNAGALVEYLGDFDTENIHELPHAKTSSQMGWQSGGEEGFLWGKRLLRTGHLLPDDETDVEEVPPEQWDENIIMFRGEDVGDEQLAEAYAPAGSFEEWQRVMRDVEPFDRIKLVIVASLAAPVLQIVGGHNFIVDISNPTSRGKTATLRLAASVWGNPDERAPSSALATWDATRVWIERASAALNNLPLLLDDTKRARHAKVVSQTLYDVASGRGRGRGSLTGLGRSGSWSTVLISTGEQPATSFTEDGGTRARVLSLWGSPFGVVGEHIGQLVADLDLRVRENYGHAGPRFVQYLLEQDWERLKRVHTKWKRRYTKKAKDDPVLSRMADYFATLRLTAMLATSAGVLPWKDFDPVGPLWDTLAAEASEADRAEQALRLVLSWAESNQHAFHGRERKDNNFEPIPPPGGHAGKWEPDEDWEQLAIFPHKIKTLLEDHGFDAESTLRTWRERLWLDFEGGDKPRNTKKVSIPVGGRPHMVVITREAYEEVMA